MISSQNYACSKQTSYRIMKVKPFANIGNGGAEHGDCKRVAAFRLEEVQLINVSLKVPLYIQGIQKEWCGFKS
jgi:hypothetical protein